VGNATKPAQGSWVLKNRRVALIATVVPFLLLGLLELLPGHFLPAIAYFVAAGIWALYVVPQVFGLPNGRKPFLEYCKDIRLLPVAPVGRNILLGLLMAALTLSSILLATFLTRHFVLDWGLVPALRWVKGLSRGVWEEVFFRGIALAILMRMYSRRKAVLWTNAIFALAHLGITDVTASAIVDVVSIFFMGLLFTYVVLKTGSLLPAIVFHYVHDVFVLLVQNAPGASEPMASALLFGFLWTALAVGAVLTRSIVEHWPAPDLSVHDGEGISPNAGRLASVCGRRTRVSR
jgi:membrane protease YdiL (CAAX protease family)